MISRYYIEDWWVTQTTFSPEFICNAFIFSTNAMSRATVDRDQRVTAKQGHHLLSRLISK